MCVEYLENHLHDESNEFDIPQLEVRPVSECRIGTKEHQKRLLKSFCLFNFKNEGFKMMSIGIPKNVTDEFWSEDRLY